MPDRRRVALAIKLKRRARLFYTDRCLPKLARFERSKITANDLVINLSRPNVGTGPALDVNGIMPER